ncbi:flagellar hook-basal body complex protein FliE [Hydrogenophaga intermedia]|jgi:flagellar hook-basal body complex protein FliE|uniref:flagellar hook-basal body complex protein FliE n=1 Tax=Hydrogenophaga intermedia TaxID=65786 RepID=UPI002044BE4E|nr:flagellar hook-basal body complex protein FliE [Hydrogenophaga intermedia]MCM3564846.1 flagellar hook-basal body complex protein FliE [Hydrogenophaga intermedia]
MDMRLTPLSSQGLAGTGALKRPAAGTAAAGGTGAAFADNLKAALGKVSDAQNQASKLQTQVQLGNPNVSLEETMIAMQKAQIGFQSALHVRNRMVQAYSDIMNMSV